MTVYVDGENKIKAVGSTEDKSLKAVYVDENHPLFPFKGWSTAKICCYKVEVYGGVVTMMTPYVDSRLLEGIDTIGGLIDDVTPYKAKKTAYIDDTEVVFEGVPKGNRAAYFSNPVEYYMEYEIETRRVVITFGKPLEQITDVTLTVQ